MLVKIVASILFTLLFAYNIKGQKLYKYPTLKYDLIKKQNISLPYINQYGANKKLLVFGSNHTSNFTDPQVWQIDSVFSTYKPTIVLYEGDGIATMNNKKETIETYFEMGLAKYIADSLLIKSINIEPETKSKYQFLLKKFNSSDILIATLGLQITLMQMNNENFEKKFPTLIADLIKEGLPLSKEQQTLSFFLRYYYKNFHKPFSYENFDSRDFQSKYSRTVFNKINIAANEFRDQHIIRLTKKYITENERVLLIVGGWHAIVCEPSFKLITK